MFDISKFSLGVEYNVQNVRFLYASKYAAGATVTVFYCIQCDPICDVQLLAL